MADLQAVFRNASHVLLVGPDDVMDALDAHLTVDLPKPPVRFQVPYADYKYHPLQRGTNRLGVGLLPMVLAWAKEHGHVVTVERSQIPPTTAYGWPTTLDWTTAFNLTHLRPTQQKALDVLRRSPRGVLLAPTAVGKSLIITNALRARVAANPNACILWLVSSTTLIGQMTTFLGQDAPELRRRLVTHRDQLQPGMILLTTYHHLKPCPRVYFRKITHIFIDEAHTAGTTSIQRILGRSTQAFVRWGFTGTLPDAPDKQMKICGGLGPAHRLTTTKRLMDRKTLAHIEIRPILYHYRYKPKGHSRWSYQEEYTWTVTHPGRLQALLGLVQAHPTDRVLVLCQRVEQHAVRLYEAIQKASGDRPVFFISGDTSTDAREQIRSVCTAHSNPVLVGTYQTLQAGVDWPRLNVIILASGTKSSIRVLQSIGRGLRRTTAKTSAVVYDLSDDCKYRRRHANIRYGLYTSEQFLVQPLHESVIE